jgi:hypothetical protein
VDSPLLTPDDDDPTKRTGGRRSQLIAPDDSMTGFGSWTALYFFLPPPVCGEYITTIGARRFERGGLFERPGRRSPTRCACHVHESISLAMLGQPRVPTTGGGVAVPERGSVMLSINFGCAGGVMLSINRSSKDGGPEPTCLCYVTCYAIY